MSAIPGTGLSLAPPKTGYSREQIAAATERFLARGGSVETSVAKVKPVLVDKHMRNKKPGVLIFREHEMFYAQARMAAANEGMALPKFIRWTISSNLPLVKDTTWEYLRKDSSKSGINPYTVQVNGDLLQEMKDCVEALKDAFPLHRANELSIHKLATRCVRLYFEERRI